jgi:hypothetical protein
MPWKERKGRKYYYVSERIGRRVVSRYIGRGHEADHIAALVEEAQQLRRAELVTCGDPLRQSALEHHLFALEAELRGDDPSPLGRLLANRVALCWLEVQHFEELLARKGAMACHERRQRSIRTTLTEPTGVSSRRLAASRRCDGCGGCRSRSTSPRTR